MFTAPDSIQDPLQRGYWRGQMETKGMCGPFPSKPPVPPNVTDQDAYYEELGYKLGIENGLKERAGIKTQN